MHCVLCGCNCNDFHLMQRQKLHILHILLSFYAWIKASVAEMLPDTQSVIYRRLVCHIKAFLDT